MVCPVWWFIYSWKILVLLLQKKILTSEMRYLNCTIHSCNHSFLLIILSFSNATRCQLLCDFYIHQFHFILFFFLTWKASVVMIVLTHFYSLKFKCDLCHVTHYLVCYMALRRERGISAVLLKTWMVQGHAVKRIYAKN